jgi:hypothetical protein
MITRRVAVFGIFPNQGSTKRLSGAVPQHAGDDWQYQHRHLGMGSVEDMLNAPQIEPPPPPSNATLPASRARIRGLHITGTLEMTPAGEMRASPHVVPGFIFGSCCLSFTHALATSAPVSAPSKAA